MLNTLVRRSRATPRAGFRPSVETLETREVPAATFTFLESSANPAAFGQPVTFTATVIGGDFPPGGAVIIRDTVSFWANGELQPFATVPVVSGRAQYTVSSPPYGLHAIFAVYNGGNEFTGGSLRTNSRSTSALLFQQVGLPPIPLPSLPPPQPSSLFATNVSSMVRVRMDRRQNRGNKVRVILENQSNATIKGPISLILDGLSRGIFLRTRAGLARANGTSGSPYVTSDVELRPGQSITLTISFSNPKNRAINFKPVVVAGAGIV